MANFTSDQSLSMALGQYGYDLITAGQTKSGSWFCAKCSDNTGVTLTTSNGKANLTMFDSKQYIFMDITTIANAGTGTVLAYRTGTKVTS